MVILLVVLLLFGGDKMPQLAKSLGKSIREFKRAANEVEREIKRAIDEVPDTPDIGTTLRQAAEKSRKKNAPRIAPTPVPQTDAPNIDPTSFPVSPAPSSDPSPSMPPSEVVAPPETRPPA